MRKETYTGLLSIHSFDEEENILFLSSLVDPLAKELQWMCRKKVTVRYWVSDTQMTKDEVNEEFVKELIGLADGRFVTRYSELTGYLWTDEELNVGGHDLIEELKGFIGNWLILEVEASA